MNYWNEICKLQKQQVEKGYISYGQSLEDNTRIDIETRLTMLEEELIDGLMYIEHIKAGLKGTNGTVFQKIKALTPIEFAKQDWIWCPLRQCDKNIVNMSDDEADETCKYCIHDWLNSQYKED